MPGLINNLSNFLKLTLFADDTSIIFTHPNSAEFEKEFNKLFEKLIIWFQTKLLSLNLNKTYYMQFLSKTNFAIKAQKGYKINQRTSVCHTNFLGLTLDNTLSWKPHIDYLTSKLNSAFYIIRSLRSFLPLGTLRMIYFSSVHTVISYGIIFWGNSSHSNTIFKLLKRLIRIMVNVRNSESCRELFKKLHILPLHSQYTLSLLLFVVTYLLHGAGSFLRS
jgi:hypothetical protein